MRVFKLFLNWLDLIIFIIMEFKHIEFAVIVIIKWKILIAISRWFLLKICTSSFVNLMIDYHPFMIISSWNTIQRVVFKNLDLFSKEYVWFIKQKIYFEGWLQIFCATYYCQVSHSAALTFYQSRSLVTKTHKGWLGQAGLLYNLKSCLLNHIVSVRISKPYLLVHQLYHMRACVPD